MGFIGFLLGFIGILLGFIGFLSGFIGILLGFIRFFGFAFLVIFLFWALLKYILGIFFSRLLKQILFTVAKFFVFNQ